MSVPPCRLLIDPVPADGAWNMALDEALLESALLESVATVRLYQWSLPTLSLGYFQSLDQFKSCVRWRGLPMVRRLSGGGAILHDQELTYSLSIPPGERAAGDPRKLYELAHAVFIQALQSMGRNAKLRGSTELERGDAFLCFARGDDFDVVCGSDKILGSAQRRRKGAILQHGSLILRRSEFAPEIPGLLDLGTSPVPLQSLIETVGAGLCRLIGDHSLIGKLTVSEHKRAENLRDLRYSRGLD